MGKNKNTFQHQSSIVAAMSITCGSILLGAVLRQAQFMLNTVNICCNESSLILLPLSVAIYYMKTLKLFHFDNVLDNFPVILKQHKWSKYDLHCQNLLDSATFTEGVKHVNIACCSVMFMAFQEACVTLQDHQGTLVLYQEL